MVKKVVEDKKEKKGIIKKIGDSAREYYDGKNMTVRYIILGFLVLLLIFQLIIPSKNKSKNLLSENLEVVEQSTGFSFLGDDVNLDLDGQIRLDRALSYISKDSEYVYKVSEYYLPEIQKIFSDYDIPRDFSYIAILDGFTLPYRNIDEKIWKDYGLQISSEIDETKNISKSTYVFADYLANLYDELKDWNLVLISYFVGQDELDDLMDDQGVDDFSDLYLSGEILDKYYQIMGYSYFFQNIDDFVDVDDVVLYQREKYKYVKVTEQKNLQKWANKNNYLFKDIKTLNPWILGNSLPKGKWEILVKK